MRSLEGTKVSKMGIIIVISANIPISVALCFFTMHRHMAKQFLRFCEVMFLVKVACWSNFKRLSQTLSFALPRRFNFGISRPADLRRIGTRLNGIDPNKTLIESMKILRESFKIALTWGKYEVLTWFLRPTVHQRAIIFQIHF